MELCVDKHTLQHWQVLTDRPGLLLDRVEAPITQITCGRGAVGEGSGAWAVASGS